MVAISFFLGVPPTRRSIHRTLRQLIRLVGRAVARRLITSFEANPPASPEEAFAWVQGAHGNSSVRQALARWIRAKSAQ